MPTHDEWSAASTQMAELTDAGILYRIRSWWAHRRLTKLGERRQRMREFLGIDSLDEDVTVAFLDFHRMVDGLRRDLDATTAYLKQADEDGTAKLNLTMANLGELTRQFHIVSRGVDSHAVLLKAWRGVPILAKASQAALKHQQQVEKQWNERRARELAEAAHVPPVAPVKQAPLVVADETGPYPDPAQLAQAAGERHAIELAARGPRLVREVTPLASEPGDHPESD